MGLADLKKKNRVSPILSINSNENDIYAICIWI